MEVVALRIEGFRGVHSCTFLLPKQVALIGPIGSGKSTVVDALSLVFGRNKLVRDLTEHDFYGSKPDPADRIRIVATLAGFTANEPSRHPDWFRAGRAVERWWNPETSEVEATSGNGNQLCVQIGYVARFDHEDLSVQQIRYFHDDDAVEDPFVDEGQTAIPYKLLSDVGFFVLPAGRTWASTISFGSELFRRAVATLGGVPAASILSYVEAVRNPDNALEDDPDLKPLIDRIDSRLAQLVPGRPRLRLRMTSTDSDSVLRALVPHYTLDDSSPLPAARHGTGLVSLQTLALLLEIGRARRDAGQSFILALEEPELHVPPGLQRRLIGDAAAVSSQLLCTTHAPRVAAFFDAQSIKMICRSSTKVADSASNRQQASTSTCRSLAPKSMVGESNSLIQLYTDGRTKLVEALMQPFLLIPEGRIDFEWLRLLLDVAETGDRPLHRVPSTVPPFGSLLGVVPTRNAAVVQTYESLRTLHENVLVLVDGDKAGDGYISKLKGCSPEPLAIVQWPETWAIEDVVMWTMEADDKVLLGNVGERLERGFESLVELGNVLKSSAGKEGGLKSHYIAHEEIAGAMKTSAKCVDRVELLLEALSCAALGQAGDNDLLQEDPERRILRFVP